MDNHDPSDGGELIPLRRDGEPTPEERESLRRTIFAPEDEVGPFSRGNLLLPRPDPEPEKEPDAFFDGLERERALASASEECNEQDATATYFDQLGSQTPVELSA